MYTDIIDMLLLWKFNLCLKTKWLTNGYNILMCAERNESIKITRLSIECAPQRR